MSDLSTREQIRATAIERLARAEYEYDASVDFHPGWEKLPAEVRERYQIPATRAVDALGDLLPTGVEWAARNTGGGAMIRHTRTEAEADRDRMIHVAATEIPWDAPHEQFDRIEQRYTTNWVEVTE